MRTSSREGTRATARVAAAWLMAALLGGGACGGGGGGGSGSGGRAAATGGAGTGGAGTGGAGTGGAGTGGDTGTGGAGTGGAGTGGAGTGGAGTGGAVPMLGLTERPSNTTCKPPVTLGQPAPTLSASGCVDPDDPTKPAAGLIPYGVNSPLWSDGADKERWMALPDGATITIKDCARDPVPCGPAIAGGTPTDEGDMDVPDGTVLVKSFRLGGKLVETRLLVKFDRDNWVGYSYEWNEAGTDANVLPDTVNGKDKLVIGPGGQQQTWHYPSRSQCLRCHTEASGVSLGLETAQLNGDHRYPVSGRTSNQLLTLAAIGVFSAPLPRPPAEMTALPAPTGDGASVDLRARSYLHANCAICHRPMGNFDAIDLRFAPALADRRLCNVNPEKGTVGVAGAKRLYPGMPGMSTMWLRMNTLDTNDRMPQIGSLVKDAPGTDLIAAWIAGIATCP
jgi:hypothetical protein